VQLAFLIRAHANRVYGEAAFDLGAAELTVLDRRLLGSRVEGTARRQLGGVDYLVAEVSGSLDGDALALLSNLSSLHALFAVEGELLRPLRIERRRAQDDDIVTIQRYVGKTNESFTHLLVNMALAAADGAFLRLLAGRRVRILDPACGRGTTLNRAVVYGADAVGIELDEREVEAYGTFLLTWLKDKRLKHAVERATLRKGRPTPAHRTTVTYGAGKDRDAHRVVDIVHDDTVRTGDHVRARSVDALVCDLPYGVQHGSRAASGALGRGPDQLLVDALPVWREALRPGGGVALAWNTRTLPRDGLLGRLDDAGFELVGGLDDVSFLHRVDRSITRDVVLARRPG
jgi:SAM-dependent methyltransferase